MDELGGSTSIFLKNPKYGLHLKCAENIVVSIRFKLRITVSKFSKSIKIRKFGTQMCQLPTLLPIYLHWHYQQVGFTCHNRQRLRNQKHRMLHYCRRWKCFEIDTGQSTRNSHSHLQGARHADFDGVDFGPHMQVNE